MMDDRFRPIFKKILMGLVLVIAILICTGLYLNRPGSIIINSQSNVELSIAEERGGAFTSLGKGEVKYSTRSIPKTIYIKAFLDGKQTVKAAKIDRGNNGKVTLSLSDTREPQEFTSASLMSPYIVGNLVQGIDPASYMLTSFEIGTQNSPRPEFITIPYLSKVVWFDQNKFVYKQFNGGVGLFDGTNLGQQAIGTEVSGEGLENISADLNNGITGLIDASMAKNRPLVIINETNLFISNDAGKSLQSIASISASDTTKLFSTEDSIYIINPEEPSAYASEETDKSNDNKNKAHNHGASITQYGYNGVKKSEFEIGSSNVTNVVSDGKKTYTLTTDGITVLSENQSQTEDFYFDFIGDIEVSNGSVYILAGTGLWVLNQSDNSLSLVSSFEKNGVALRDSMSIQNGFLYFGTTPKSEKDISDTRVFKIAL